MKNVLFKSIEIQNFLSIGKNPLKINFTEGINIITGENLDNIGSKNGIGKSSILNAIFWVIFGETIHDLKKNKIKNNQTDEKCSGLLSFNINNDYFIVNRVLEPSSVSIFKNNENITLSTIDKNNDYIQNILNLNKEVFKNSIILTSDNTIPFLAQKKTDKRKFIEGILSLNIFSEMLLKVRKDYNEKKKENDIDVSLFENENQNLERLIKQKNANIQIKEQKILNKRKYIEENCKKIKELKKEDGDTDAKNKKLNEELKELLNEQNKLEEQDLEQINKEILEISNNKTLIISSIKHKKDELLELKKETGECPTCNRPYSTDTCGKEKRIESIQKEIEELLSNYEMFKQKECQKNDIYNTIKSKKREIYNKIESCNNNLKNLNVILHEIDKLNNENSKIELDIIEIDNEKDSTELLIEESIEKNKVLKEKIKNNHKELDILETAKMIVSEEGVKTIIIDKVLFFLNNRLNFYLDKLNAPCQIEFNETFDCDIKNFNGLDIDYWNMSSGERKRTDAAIIFTFQDLLSMKSGMDYNLNMYDEWADSSLDEKGFEGFFEILKERSEEKNQCIYIIGHSPNLMKYDINNIIFLQKKDGVTTLKHD
jgi:DNA repair exonuclease SbcCD ATPase subunit